MGEVNLDDYRRILMSDLSDPSWREFKENNFIEIAKVFKVDRGFELSKKQASRGFELAKNLLPELAEYTDLIIADKPRLNEITYLYSSLVDSLSDFEDASFTDFEFLVENASICLFSHILFNVSFPVALFVENKRVQNYIISEEANRVVLSYWSQRRDEVAVYLRDTVSDYKYMSDEMILSIAGIQL